MLRTAISNPDHSVGSSSDGRSCKFRRYIQVSVGHTTIQNFCEYLIQLRTCKLADSNKIKRFTLNESEFTTLRSFESVASSRTYVRTRSPTRNKSDKTKTERKFEKLTNKLGPIKTFTFKIATSKSWEIADFHRTKEDLREIYSVHAKIPVFSLQKTIF